MTVEFRAPRGTRDIVYPESEKMQTLLSEACGLMERYGYRLIETPVLENTELFVRGIGRETDIVNKEMYTFEDRGGESLTLRPEGTAPVVRAFLERGLASKGLPLKVCYAGPMFRRERPQSGRYRQFCQVGAEAIGSDDPLLDAEIVSISDVLLRMLGVEDYRLLVNSVGCRECRPSYVEALVAFLRSSDGLCRQCRQRSESNPLRVFDCKEPGCAAVLEEAPSITDSLCIPCREHFDEVRRYLDILGVSFQADRSLVRGLDYYTRTTFEFKVDGLGAQDTVSAGGRYDYLVEELGGPPTPGVGYSLGVERLMMCLPEGAPEPAGERGADLFVARAEGLEREVVIGLTGRAREAGLRADMDYMGRGLRSQLKNAARLGARLALIAGPEEYSKGLVVLRDMDSSTQREVLLEEAIDEAVSELKGE